jgi:hypothetical protein
MDIHASARSRNPITHQRTLPRLTTNTPTHTRAHALPAMHRVSIRPHTHPHPTPKPPPGGYGGPGEYTFLNGLVALDMTTGDVTELRPSGGAAPPGGGSPGAPRRTRLRRRRGRACAPCAAARAFATACCAQALPRPAQTPHSNPRHSCRPRAKPRPAASAALAARLPHVHRRRPPAVCVWRPRLGRRRAGVGPPSAVLLRRAAGAASGVGGGRPCCPAAWACLRAVEWPVGSHGRTSALLLPHPLLNQPVPICRPQHLLLWTPPFPRRGTELLAGPQPWRQRARPAALPAQQPPRRRVCRARHPVWRHAGVERQLAGAHGRHSHVRRPAGGWGGTLGALVPGPLGLRSGVF